MLKCVLLARTHSKLHADQINTMMEMILRKSRLDRDEPLSAMLPTVGSFSPSPFVVRFQPHITMQASKPQAPWADKELVDEMRWVVPHSVC